MNIFELSSALLRISYPPEMEYVECGIFGQGFYPGCKGFSHSPENGILLLARDWGKESDYKRLKGEPARDEDGITWRMTCAHYLSSLDDLPLWCTNYLMGVRKFGSAEGNVLETIADQQRRTSYESSCWHFLHRQVLLQKPRVIVVFNRFNRADLLMGRFGRADLRVAGSRVSEDKQAFRAEFQWEGMKHATWIVRAHHPRHLSDPRSHDQARRRVELIRKLYS